MKALNLSFKQVLPPHSSRLKDDEILNIILDFYGTSEPRAIRIFDNEVQIRNYSLEGLTDDWLRRDVVLLRWDFWFDILGGSIRILGDAEGRRTDLVYAIDVTRKWLRDIIVIILMAFVMTFIIYKGSGSLQNAIDLTYPVFLGITALVALLELIFSMAHRGMLRNCISRIAEVAAEGEG